MYVCTWLTIFPRQPAFNYTWFFSLHLSCENRCKSNSVRAKIAFAARGKCKALLNVLDVLNVACVPDHDHKTLSRTRLLLVVPFPSSALLSPFSPFFLVCSINLPRKHYENDSLLSYYCQGARLLTNYLSRYCYLIIISLATIYCDAPKLCVLRKKSSDSMMYSYLVNVFGMEEQGRL